MCLPTSANDKRVSILDKVVCGWPEEGTDVVRAHHVTNQVQVWGATFTHAPVLWATLLGARVCALVPGPTTITHPLRLPSPDSFLLKRTPARMIRSTNHSPMPIPAPAAPPMESRGSHSPVELPTPPDGVGLPAPPRSLREGSSWLSATPLTRKPLPTLTPAYRAELPRYSSVPYMGLRPHGSAMSTFQLSAERQHASESADDTDMSVDDVFATSYRADDRRTRTVSHYADVDDVSPNLVPHMDNDEMVPSLEHSYPRSPLVRRTSLRSVDTFNVVPGPSSRRMPYNIPSRSPGAVGPLSQAYAMSMTPSSTSMRTTRLPPWTSFHRASKSTRPSTSAPMTSHGVLSAYDEDETDDEVSAAGIDDEMTDDDTELPMRIHGRGVPMHTTKRSDMMMPTVTGGGRLSLPHSLPTRPLSSSYGRSPDESSRSQMHMAVAALDRLSMAGTSVEDEKKMSMRTYVDETDEVAAIRDRLGGAANCSAFISKLWHLMINPDLYGKYIHWNEAGDAIIINSEPEVAAEFAADVLPKLFKHGNNASFVRQLNLYGFQRVSSSRLLDAVEMQVVAARTQQSQRIGASTTGPYNTATELYGMHSSFAHPRFRRGQEAWLASMKPRSSKKPKKPPTSEARP